MEEFGEREKDRYKRAVLIAAGSFYGLPFSLTEEDFLVAIDGGMHYYEALQITPNLLIGDMDSYGKENQEKGESGERRENGKNASFLNEKESTSYSIFDKKTVGERERFIEKAEREGDVAGKSSSIPLYRLPHVKNDTDLQAALKLVLSKGIREVHILAALGGERIDHSYAAMQSLAFLAEEGAEGYLYGKNQLFTALRNGKKDFTKEYRGYLSVFSFTDLSCGVSESGLLYRINNVELKSTNPIGVSNEFIGEEAEVSVKNGILILSYAPLQG